MKLDLHKDLDLAYGSSGEKNRAWMIIKPEIWRVGVKNHATFDIYLGEIRKMGDANIFKIAFALLKEENDRQNEN
jgi:hypothetical protein